MTQYKSKIEEYFSSPAISNSLLGAMQNPRYIWMKQQGLVEEDKDKIHFKIGSGVDCILTNQLEWVKEFLVADSNNVPIMMGKFIKALPKNLTADSPEESYKEAWEASGYKQGLSTVIKSFWKNEDYVHYYKAVSEGGNKTVLTKQEYEVILSAYEAIATSPECRWYFSPIRDGIDIHKQIPIYFEYKGESCKALLDGIVINHNERVIYPYDLKTIGKGVFNFPDSFWRYGYYRQAAWYLIALQHYIKYLNTQYMLEGKDIDLSTYTIAPFRFIVVSSRPKNYEPALIYLTTPNDLEVGLNGGFLKEDNKYVPGVNQLLEDYKWHVKNNLWEVPRAVYENNYNLTLDAFVKSTDPKEHDISSSPFRGTSASNVT